MDEVLHHKDKNTDWCTTTGKERNQTLVYKVWISSGKVSMINPSLRSWWDIICCVPRWAAVFLLCNQARWMESAVSCCWIYLLHYSVHMLTFTSNSVFMEGVLWSVLEALHFSTHPSADFMKGLRIWKMKRLKYSKINKTVHSSQLLLACYGFVHVVPGTKLHKLWYV